MADSVELATGYVSLSVSTRNMGRDISRQFAGVPKTADRAGKESGKRFSAGFAGVAKVGVLGAVLAAGAAVKGIGATIASAGDLEQSVGGVQAVFKDYAKTIKKDSENAANSVGLSKDAFNDLATTLGSSLKNKGIKDYGKQTETLIGLGSDLSAQFGGSTKDAVEALSSLLRGESDPIEKYGISINETAVNAELAAKGQTKLKGAALEQAKTQARLKLAFEQSKDAQGAFARESDTLQGKQQRAAAAWENLKAKIGGIFLPIASRAMGFISKTMLPGLDRLADFLSKNVGPAFSRVKDFLAPVIGAFKGFSGGLRGIAGEGAPAASFFKDRFLPALLGIVDAGKRLAAVVLPIIQQIAGAFLREWPKIQPVVMGIFHTIGGIVTDIMGAIQNRIRVVTAVISFIWRHWGGQITTIVVSVFSTVVKVIAGALKIVGGIVKVVTGLMTGDWRKAGRGIKQIVGGLRDILVAIFTNMRKILTALLGNLIINLTQKWIGFLAYTRGRLKDGLARIRDFILGPIRSARDQLATVLGQIRTKFSSAVTAIGTAWDRLKEVAKRPIRFVVNTVLNDGLIGAFNKIAGFVGIGKIDRIALPPGFHAGGWTGPGLKYQPAGIVHADEFVIRKDSRRRIERDSPGLLDRLNGYAKGGLVGGSGRFSPLFESRLMLASQMANTVFHIFQRGFRPATSYSGTSHQGDAVDLGPITTAVIRALRSVGVAAWDRTNKGNWAPHIHGVPLPGAGHGAGSAIWQAQDYLRGGDGLGGRDNGPRVGIIGKIGEFLKAGFKSFTDWFGGLVKDPLAKLKSITGSPFGQLAAGLPRMLVEGMSKKISVLDTGGRLEPGFTFNGTGRRELVLNGPQERLVTRALDVVSGGSGLTINGGVHGYTAAEVAAEIEKRARRMRALQPSYA